MTVFHRKSIYLRQTSAPASNSREPSGSPADWKPNCSENMSSPARWTGRRRATDSPSRPPLDGGCHPPVQFPGRRLPRPGRPHGRADNFDHHTHGTEAEECGEEGHEHETTTPVHPWIYNRDSTIPAGSRVYDASVPITVPANTISRSGSRTPPDGSRSVPCPSISSIEFIRYLCETK